MIILQPLESIGNGHNNNNSYNNSKISMDLGSVQVRFGSVRGPNRTDEYILWTYGA